MIIRDIMTHDLEGIQSNATVSEAARKMKTRNVGILAVFEGARESGMITDRDIVIQTLAENMDPSKTLVNQIMSKEVIACNEDDEVSRAVEIMQKHKIRRLLVRNEKLDVTGIVSLGDIAVHTQSDLSGKTLHEISKPSQPHR